MLRISRLLGGGFLLLVVLVLVARLLGAPLGAGFAGVPLGPKQEPVVLTIWYSTEKQQWLEQAVVSFHAANPTANGRPIEVQLVGMGSNDMIDRVARQDWAEAPPAVVIPASSSQIAMLNQAAGAEVLLGGADTPQSLVVTPLVLIGWQERAQTLWPSGPPQGAFWQSLHDALLNEQGWQALGGSASWGPVKFGHTSPVSSNSGEQTLLMLAYSYANKASGLSVADVQNPEFQQWLGEIESTVPEFGTSTGTFMSQLVQFGPGKYDFAAVYENVALLNQAVAQRNWGQPLQIFYPPVTLLSDHPFAILRDASADEQQAARELRTFLLGDTAQQQALASGFRPVSASVSLNANVPNNPFIDAQTQGLRTDIGAPAEVPPADVTQALLESWRARFAR